MANYKLLAAIGPRRETGKADIRMRSHLAVPPPLLDDDLVSEPCAEPYDAGAIAAVLAVEQAAFYWSNGDQAGSEASVGVTSSRSL